MDEAEALANRVAVINNGKIIEVSTPENLGGRNDAKARVAYLSEGGRVEILTDSPTQTIAELMSKFNGEIPELTVSRPTLEDMYLEMIEGQGDQS